MPDATPRPIVQQAPSPADAAQRSAAAVAAARDTSQPYDHVDAAGDASFPASDPPSWWSGA